MVALTVTSGSGNAILWKLKSTTRNVELTDLELRRVDLTEVRDLPKLRKVFIRSDKLESLDLTPLTGTPIEELRLVLPVGLGVTLPANCRALKNLIISGGPSSLDLAPIAKSPIQDLLIFDAPIVDMDLGPLAHCKSLSIMWLMRSKLRTLDLRPLAKLPALEALELSGTTLTSVQVTPGFKALKFLHLYGNPLGALDLGAFTTVSTTMTVLNLPTSLQGKLDIGRRKGLEVQYFDER